MAHNTRRWDFFNEHGQNPVLLQWDVELQENAQQWADESGCETSHDPNNSIEGENLVANWGSGGARTPEQVLVAWWDEERQLAESGSYVLEISHLTQAAWSTTTKLGCATSTKSHPT